MLLTEQAIIIQKIKQSLMHLEVDLLETIKMLEDTPRHRISVESTMLEKDNERLIQVKKMKSDIDKFLKSINTPL